LTLAELIQKTESRLKAARLHYGHGTDNPRDEAAFLVLRGLKLPFDTDLNTDVDPKRVEHLLERRIKERIPAAYLLNEAWLDGMAFHVDRRVIIPRSHIAFVLKDLRVAPRRILDLCTGSGCLAILLAYHFPNADVDAADISSDALAVAQRNVAEHSLQGRVNLIRSDLLSNLTEKRYDLIVSNPPYVTSMAMEELPPEYGHEPGLALAGGDDGLDAVRTILAGAADFLTPEGLLIVEVGQNRAAAEAAFPRLPFTWLATESSEDSVFLLTRAELVAGERVAA
jgi:ribosomal protein L3 glutamine methyltransferase